MTTPDEEEWKAIKEKVEEFHSEILSFCDSLENWESIYVAMYPVDHFGCVELEIYGAYDYLREGFDSLRVFCAKIDEDLETVEKLEAQWDDPFEDLEETTEAAQET